MASRRVLTLSLGLILLPGAGRAHAPNDKPLPAEADEEEVKHPCTIERTAYDDAGRALSKVTLASSNGDAEAFAKAKDAAARAQKLARDGLARCAVDEAFTAKICSRELKALIRSEADYNNPALGDTDGELTRKTHMAAKNLEACLLGGEINIPADFVDKNRELFTQTAQAAPVK